MIYLKIHKSEHGAVVGMCDESLIDKTLEEGHVFIDIRAYSSFYKGELVSKENTLLALKALRGNVYSANIIGKDSVELAITVGIIKKENVLKVKGIPYAQAYNVNIA